MKRMQEKKRGESQLELERPRTKADTGGEDEEENTSGLTSNASRLASDRRLQRNMIEMSLERSGDVAVSGRELHLNGSEGREGRRGRGRRMGSLLSWNGRKGREVDVGEVVFFILIFVDVIFLLEF